MSPDVSQKMISFFFSLFAGCIKYPGFALQGTQMNEKPKRIQLFASPMMFQFLCLLFRRLEKKTWGGVGGGGGSRIGTGRCGVRRRVEGTRRQHNDRENKGSQQMEQHNMN